MKSLVFDCVTLCAKQRWTLFKWAGMCGKIRRRQYSCLLISPHCHDSHSLGRFLSIWLKENHIWNRTYRSSCLWFACLESGASVKFGQELNFFLIPSVPIQCHQHKNIAWSRLEPSRITEILVPCEPGRGLGSCDQALLAVQNSKLKSKGVWAVSIKGPRLWN